MNGKNINFNDKKKQNKKQKNTFTLKIKKCLI